MPDNPLVDLVRTFNLEAIGVYEHVSAQQQIANITVDRSIELYMIKNDVLESGFARLKKAYERMAKMATDAGLHIDKCATCPDA